MNLDERLEALTQSVEPLATMHKDNEKLMRETHEATQKELLRLGRYIHNVSELILDHETRLRNLEGDNEGEEPEEE
jgi:hypothetical protein